MMSKDKNISAWQMGIMVFVIMFTNKFLMFPSLLFDKANVGAMIVPFVLFLFELGLLFLFYKTKKKYPTESFSQILKMQFGKIVTTSIFVLIMIFFVSKAAIFYTVVYNFFRNIIYIDASNIMFLLCFLPVITHLAISGLQVLGRTVQLFFPVIFIIALFCIVVGIYGIDGKPLLVDLSLPKIAMASFKHLSSFGDIIFIFVIIDKINIKKGEWKVIFSLAGIAMLFVCAITIVFILTFSYTSFMHPYALFEITSYLQDYGGMGKIDIIPMTLIMVFSFFEMAIHMKTFMLSFQSIFEKIDGIYSVLTFDICFVILVYFLISKIEKTIFYIETIFPYVAILPFLIIPLVVCISILHKSRKKEKKE